MSLFVPNNFIMSDTARMINLLILHSISHQGSISPFFFFFFSSTVFLESAYLTKTFPGLIKISIITTI